MGRSTWAAGSACYNRCSMANIKSQIKRNRQNERKRERNLATRTRLKTEAKKARVQAGSGDAAVAVEQLRTTSRMLDKAASKGAVHKRTAARRKSRLARSVARGGDSS
jgi:small subunit ribosomal protein S20